MSSSASHPLLLDTHTWIWLVNGDVMLSPRARRAIATAAVGSRVLVSAISAWELALLESKGRVRLDRDCEAWVQRALSLPGLRLVPIDEIVAVSSTRLPGTFHGDPADRLLVATARALDATFVTRDRAILDYARAGYLRTLAA